MTAEILGFLVLPMVFRVTLAVCLIGVCGCARWDKTDSRSEFKFPQGRLASDAVALEIGIAQLDVSQTEVFEQFWNLMDQQELALPQRQLMDQNGLRVAIMASHAPAILNELLAPRPLEFEDLTIVEEHMMAEDRLEPKSRMVLHQRIANRNGQAHPIQTSKVHPQFRWTIRNADLQSIGTGQWVRGFFDVTTLPEGDGTVRLQFSPQIHHGEVRPSFGVANKAFFMDSSQTVNKLAELMFTLRVRPGETVVIAPTSDVEDLGSLFFGEPESASDQPARETNMTHRVLLVRVVQTQMDDLFGNSASNERLTTTSAD